MGDIKVVLGDALKRVKDIENESVDLVIADPPYNLWKNYGNDSDSKNFKEYLNFTKEWTSEAKRILKKNGTLYSFMGYRFISYSYKILERDQKLNFNNWIT